MCLRCVCSIPAHSVQTRLHNNELTLRLNQEPSLLHFVCNLKGKKPQAGAPRTRSSTERTAADEDVGCGVSERHALSKLSPPNSTYLSRKKQAGNAREMPGVAVSTKRPAGHSSASRINPQNADQTDYTRKLFLLQFSPHEKCSVHENPVCSEKTSISGICLQRLCKFTYKQTHKHEPFLIGFR